MALPGPTQAQKPLMDAIQNGDLKALQKILADEPSIDLNFTMKVNGNDRTPLGLAAREGNLQAVKMLIDRGANVNFPDTSNWTPLHIAAYYGQSDVIFELLNRGADINLLTMGDFTPLQIAKDLKDNEAKKAEIVGMLEAAAAEEEKSKVPNASSFVDSIAKRLSSSTSALEPLFSQKIAADAEETEDLVGVTQGNAAEVEDLFNVQSQPQPQPQPITSSFTAITSPKPSDRSFGQKLLSDDQMSRYKELFPDGEDHYAKLAKIIKHQNEAASSSLEGKTANFQRRLKNIIPAVQFAVQGAREEYRKDPSNKALKARMEAFEAIQDMLISLKSLTKNKSRYTKEHLEKRLGEINAALNSAGCSSASAIVVAEALRDVAENNTFKKRKFYQSDSLGMGSTPFDTSEPSMKVGDVRKRVKIEHSNNGKEVSAIFSYSRNKLLGQFSKKIWTTRASEFKNFQSQIRYLANEAIIEYRKGSKDNPIQISYIGPPQPEAAIMLLIEFKKRAILEGKTFHAIHNGTSIEITPNQTFGTDEKDYFMKYALEHPQFAKESDLVATKGCAGYKVFKQGGVEMNKTKDKDIGTEQEKSEVGDAMQKFLDMMVEKSRAKLNRKMDVVANELCEVNRLNSWKDGTARKPPMFRA